MKQLVKQQWQRFANRVKHLALRALWTGNGVPGKRGPKPTDLHKDLAIYVADIVERAWVMGIPIQSDWARLNAGALSAAASLGLITSFDGQRFGRTWRPTVEGLLFLEEQ